MEFTFEELNSQMQDILTEYSSALNNGDYAKAKQITASVLQLFRDTYGVNLDTKPEFDHVFQEVMSKMQKELQDSRPQTQADTLAEIDIINMFSEVADGVFKVSDIRRKALELDPSAEELISTYEEGIEDADNQIASFNRLRELYDEVLKSVYGEDIPDLKTRVENGKYFIQTLNDMALNTNIMDDLQGQIYKMEDEIEVDPSKEALYREKINANKSAIEEYLKDSTLKFEDLTSKGLDLSDLKDIISEDNFMRVATCIEFYDFIDEIEAQLRNDYSEIKYNLLGTKYKYGSRIPEIGAIDLISMSEYTEEGRKAIDEALNPFLELSDRVDNGLKIQANRKKIFEHSIEEVREEQKVLDIDVKDEARYRDHMPDDVKSRIEAEKAYYRQDMFDKMYGNSEKAKKWKEYYTLFKSAQKVVPFTFKDETGHDVNASYLTIDNEKFKRDLLALNPPVEYKDAMRLLQLDEYKVRLERLSKYQAGDKSVISQCPSYAKYSQASEEVRTATTPEAKKSAKAKLAQAWNDIQQEIKEDQIYIATNHGATDNYEIIAEAISNAGSLVKYKNGRLAYKDQPTLGGKIKAFGHNYTSLIGLRTIDSAKTPLGKVATVALDAGLIALSPFNGAIKVVYRYTPIIGKEAQAKRYIKEHAGENSSPYEGRKDARKMKRRKEYKSEMRGAFKGARAWIKATNDDLFNHSRREETEKAFAERRLQEEVYPSIENRYVAGAKYADIQSKKTARENMEQRVANARTISRRSYAYNDLIREPVSAEQDELRKQSILGATLEEHGEDASKLRYSQTDRPRDRRFVKENEGRIGTIEEGIDSGVDYSRPLGSVVQTDAIDRATRQEAVNSTYTARNYIPYAITGVAVGMAGRYAFSKIQTEFEKVIPGETRVVRDKRFAGYEQYDDHIDVPHTSTEVDTSTVARTTRDFAMANDNQNVHLHRSVWGGERGGYDVDLSSYDHSAAFYTEIPDASGKLQKISIVIPQDRGKYDYLGRLVTEYGLDKSTVEKYIDITTGTFKPDADLYSLAAEISNKTGVTSNLTGDKLVEMVFNGTDGTKAYIEALKTYGGRNGGWVDVTKLGQTLGTKEITTYTTETIPRTRPVWEYIRREITDPDKVEVVTDTAKEAVKKAGEGISSALAVGHVIEATDKAIGGDSVRDTSKRETRQDLHDEVEPGRGRRTRRPISFDDRDR